MSKNISKEHREDLLKKIKEIKAFIIQSANDKNRTKLLSYMSDLVHEVNGKKYGLVFEEHREDIDELLTNNVPVLCESEDLFVDGGGEINFLLEGDNLASLKLLEKTHRGKIDVIYIDPPYNTGNKDFVYDDNFIDNTDTFRHSKWLSFMEQRLYIAKELLTESGVIFISIDDNEHASLKLLCDEIFGINCFISNVCWQRTYSPRNDSKGISQENEYILVYSKSIGWEPKKLPRTEEMDLKYKNPDNDVKPWTSSDAFAPSAISHQGMVYAIQHPFTGKLIYPYKGACWPLQQDKMYEEISKWGSYEYKDLHDEKERAEVCGVSTNEIRKGVLGIVLADSVDNSKKRAQQIYNQGRWPKFYFTNKGLGGIRRKTYIDNVGGKIVTNFWPYKEVGHTDFAQKEIKSIFTEKVFSTPKPTTLIERILQISKQSMTILDFFAGSGTTGHAVLKLNAEDGGHRKFILCTNNENNICRDITYERIKTVITGKRKDGSKYSEGLPGSLKYFKIDFVPISDKLYYEYADELLLHIRELVELENAIDFKNDNTVAIVLSDEELEKFIENLKKTQGADCVKTLYMGHDVLASSEQERLLKNHGITINIVPDYYYRELAL